MGVLRPFLGSLLIGLVTFKSAHSAIYAMLAFLTLVIIEEQWEIKEEILVEIKKIGKKKK